MSSFMKLFSSLIDNDCKSIQENRDDNQKLDAEEKKRACYK